MDDPRRRVIKFIEKEIKTYKALALFLSKKGIREHVRVGQKKVLISPTFYNDRMKEARSGLPTIRRRVDAFCDRFGLKVPILLGPMAGASVTKTADRT